MAYCLLLYGGNSLCSETTVLVVEKLGYVCFLSTVALCETTGSQNVAKNS